jgi:hypothetical protein
MPAPSGFTDGGFKPAPTAAIRCVFSSNIVCGRQPLRPVDQHDRLVGIAIRVGVPKQGRVVGRCTLTIWREWLLNGEKT